MSKGLQRIRKMNFFTFFSFLSKILRFSFFFFFNNVSDGKMNRNLFDSTVY